MTLSVVVTLTSLARAIVAPLLAAYRGATAGCLFFSFFNHIITSMFYHLLSVTCCGMSSRLIIKRRYTHIYIVLAIYMYMYIMQFGCMSSPLPSPSRRAAPAVDQFQQTV